MINDNNIDLLNEMINSHPLRYFFNLKLDKNEFSLFHKIIIFEQKRMFYSVLELFKNRFSLEINKEKSYINNSINSINSNSFYDEEKKSTDSEYIDEIKISRLLSMKDKDGNTPILFAAYKGNVGFINQIIRS